MTVRIDSTLGELVKIISKSKRNIFPVIDFEENFCGVVFLDDIREFMFDKEKYNNTLVKNLMIMPPAVIAADEKMENVMKKFNDSGVWNLPVVNNGKYIGFISKSTIFNAYRAELVRFSDE